MPSALTGCANGAAGGMAEVVAFAMPMNVAGESMCEHYRPKVKK